MDTQAHPQLGTHGCWGANDAHQIGDGTTTPRAFVTPMPRAEGKLTDLSIGERHACAVFDDRRSYCWGDGSRGQLGAPIAQSATPVPTSEGSESEGKGTVAVRVGGAHTCVRANDRLRCFGADDEGQLGTPAPALSSPWSRGTEIRAFALGQAHTCAAFAGTTVGDVNQIEEVVCRGRASAAPAEPVLRGVPVRALAAGAHHTCALLENRTVRCWGKNDAGQLGDGTTNDSLVPVNVLHLAGIAAIAAGARHTCALIGNGTIACWGENAQHQLSDGTTERRSRPAVVVGLVGGRQIAAAGNSSCALLDGGFVRCWGPNDRYQLGDGSTIDHSVPMPITFR